MVLSLRWFGAKKKTLSPDWKLKALYLWNLEFPSPEEALCQDCLKMAECLWRFWRRFLSYFSYFWIFHNYLSLKNVMALHLNKLAFSSPTDALCQVGFKMAERFWSSRFLYLHFLKKVQEYCCYPCPSVRPSKEFLVTWAPSTSKVAAKLYKRIWLGMFCWCAIRFKNFHFYPRGRSMAKKWR